MRYILILLAVAFSNLPGAYAEALMEKVMEIGPAQVDQVRRLLGADDGSKSLATLGFYKINYETQDAFGRKVPVSGMMIIPKLTFRREFALVVYHHGTTTKKTLVPSNPLFRETLLSAAVFASGGYIVLAPDYVGLGDSPGPHPFLHAETQARASADLIEVGKKLVARLGVKLSGQLLLTGYSQGGHAAMSTHIYLEKNLSFYDRVRNRTPVTAGAPMAGPYDLSQTSTVGALRNPSRSTSAYVAYLTLAMNQVYGLYSDLKDLYLAPYDTLIPQLLDGTHELEEVIQALPNHPDKMMRPEIIQGILSDSLHPLRRALALNDVAAWKARAPVRLFYGESDLDVPHENALVAARQMVAMGSKVDLVSLGNVDHFTGVLPAFVGVRVWFDQVRRQKMSRAKGESVGMFNRLMNLHPFLAE